MYAITRNIILPLYFAKILKLIPIMSEGFITTVVNKLTVMLIVDQSKTEISYFINNNIHYNLYSCSLFTSLIWIGLVNILG